MLLPLLAKPVKFRFVVIPAQGAVGLIANQPGLAFGNDGVLYGLAHEPPRLARLAADGSEAWSQDLNVELVVHSLLEIDFS